VLTTPNPVELAKLVDPEAVAQHRSLFCTCYDECLERAAQRGWRSWSCERCPVYALRYSMASRYARETYHGARGAETAGAP
jgi:hypothetical protein